MAATVSQDQKLRILSLPDGAEHRVIDVAGRNIDVFAFSPDGQSVAIGDHKGRVSVWATETGQVRFELQLARYPGIAVFSRNGALLAITSQGDAVQLIDVGTGKPSAVLGTPIGGTSTLAFSRDGRIVATGDGDAVVRVYDVRTGKRLAENRELLMIPLAIDVSADGATAIVGGGDKTLLFIDTATGKTLRRLDRTMQPPAILEVAPDGKSFTIAYMNAANMTVPDHVVIAETSSGQPQLDWLPPAFPVGGGWTSDGRMLVAIASKDALHLWQLR